MSRGLTEEDRALWDRVARTARRLQPEERVTTLPELVTASEASRGAPKRASEVKASKGIIGLPSVIKPNGSMASATTRIDLMPPLHEALRAAPLRMDPSKHKKMIRGKLDPDARIDLHGMTRAEAREALLSFVLASRARGCRLLLVITGKGRERDDREDAPMPSRKGTLRHDLPHWLEHPLLRQAVLELRPAHRSHGGGGAFYLYLRKIR